MPENFLKINRYFALTLYCNTIAQSNNAFSILGFSLAAKSPCFDLFIHWLIKQIRNTYRNHFQGHTKIALLIFFSFVLLFSPFLLISHIFFILSLRRRKRNKNTPPPITARRYRPARKSGVVHLETIDEDFTVPQRRLRATPPTTDSFREVSRGLGVASRAMYQLSRVGQGSQLEQARRARSNMEPSLESFEFDDWMESIVSD